MKLVVGLSTTATCSKLRRECSMTILEGDRLRDRFTGQSFIVKKIMDRTVLLEAEGTPDRFYLGDALVELLFERAENREHLN